MALANGGTNEMGVFRIKRAKNTLVKQNKAYWIEIAYVSEGQWNDAK